MAQYDQQQPIDIKKLRPIFIGVGILFFIIMFGRSSFIILEPTERGILFKKYTTGLDIETIYGEGLNIVAPWNSMIIYDVSEQKLEERMDVLSSDGLSIDIDVSVRFHPNASEIGELYQGFKIDYQDKLVRQELRAAVRKVVGRYTPEELYSTKREEIETTIREYAEDVLTRNHVVLRALLIRSIKLPQSIQQAIESKLRQEQESLAYKYRLDKELSEAERKRIAAEGEATANKIINNSLTPSLLRMRGIEATTELAKSPNTKTIIIGSGKDGLPLILGGQ
ncbi:MAG: prohibitin family protein [Flavobacteriales bacterium]|nr:prohibitin family protein [Flavobacteriales bacterium]